MNVTISRRLHTLILLNLFSAWAFILLICFLHLLPKRASQSHPARTLVWSSIEAILQESISNHLTELRSNRSGVARGVDPDTLLRIMQIQDTLSCVEDLPKWMTNVKPPQKQPRAPGHEGVVKPPRCFSRSSPTDATALVPRLCSVLSTKKILFVGSVNTFHLHSVLLNAIGTYQNRSFPCRGPDFCTFHHICEPVLDASEVSVDNSRFKKAPSEKDLLESGSSLLRYVISDSLFVSNNSKDIVYTTPIVDPWSRTRVRNAHWYAHARKADVMLMGRPPMSAPPWSYTDHEFSGNWTRTNRPYLDPSLFRLEDQLSIQIVDAALQSTLRSFLPSSMHTFHNLLMDSSSRRKLLVWHGSWYLSRRCTALRSPENAFLVENIFPLSAHPPTFIDPWSLYHNVQGYLQNRLMRILLPYYGVIYLSLPVAHDSFALSEENTQCRKRIDRELAIQFLHSFVTLMEKMI